MSRTRSFVTDSLKPGTSALLLLAILWAGGCRSQAHRDLYVDQMAQEIRQLEDRLYEANYENEVLQEQLTRARSGSKAAKRVGKEKKLKRDQKSAAELRDVLPPRQDAIDQEDSLDEHRVPIPGTPGQDADDLDSQSIPPSEDDFTLPDIEIGEPVPPGELNAPPHVPPGQIPKPKALQDLEQDTLPLPQATALQIDAGRSGTHRFENQTTPNGVYIVINMVDSEGNVLDLSRAEIDAELSIIVHDPHAGPENERVGRWNFSAAEIATMRHSTPVDSIHVPLRWNETVPGGETIEAYLQLGNGEHNLYGRGVIALKAADTYLGQRNSGNL